MAATADSIQAKWAAQLESMRQTIAELKSLHIGEGSKSYGDDLMIDDDDFPGGSSSDDVFNISDDEEEDYSSDSLDAELEAFPSGDTATSSYGKDWLRARCTEYADRKSGLDAQALEEQVVALLASDSQGS